MTSFFKKKSVKLITLALTITLLAGCSKPAPSPNSDSSRKQGEKVENVQQNSGPSSNPSSPQSKETPKDSQKERLSYMMQLAKQGRIINCEFPVKTTVIDTVEERWGKPDKTDWVPAAKGTYVTYLKKNVVFGFNKGSQIFEVRSFDRQLGEISFSKVQEVFGTPVYNHKSNGEQIIGYIAGQDYKLLLVFPQAKDSSDDPKIDHYSVLYPKGTVNLMADDPGRQW